MRLLTLLSLVLCVFSNETCIGSNETTCQTGATVPNGCISFSVGQGTGCAWMCEYCQTNLGTTNYYFTDGVCNYQSGGCSGNPVVGKQYTCCSI